MAIDVFVAVTAVGGGLALATGMEGSRFPADWLAGTPFDTYLGPGLLLAVVIGGAAAVAAVTTARTARPGGRVSMVAGAMLATWILGEIVILTNDGVVVSPTEAIYLGVATAIVALGFVVHRRPSVATTGDGAGASGGAGGETER